MLKTATKRLNCFYLLTFFLLFNLFLTRNSSAAIKSSSTYIESTKPQSLYAASNLIDGNPSTIWREGKEGSGIGESFTFDLPRSDVKKVVIFPGDGSDEKKFKKFSHLKTVKVEFLSSDGTSDMKVVKEITHTFKDEFKAQEIPVGLVKIGNELFGGQLRVTIIDVYAGIDLQDTVVGEVYAILDEYPAQTAIKDAIETQKGSDKEYLIDSDEKTVWVSGKPDLGQKINISSPDFGLSAITIKNGYNDDKFSLYSRPKDITIEIQGKTIKKTLKDIKEAQRIDFDIRNGYNGTFFAPITITIDSVYAGKNPQISIGEIVLLATNFTI